MLHLTPLQRILIYLIQLILHFNHEENEISDGVAVDIGLETQHMEIDIMFWGVFYKPLILTSFTTSDLSMNPNVSFRAQITP